MNEEIMDIKPTFPNKNVTDEQRKVAYALNLCTVSVSQIIDYNDVNVLEQEYETILNNLNIEHMPKDESLLNTFMRLMETITFFKIQEGDKKLIEQEYQQKMRNAIWSAIPNLTVILATKDPASAAIALASQVGIGYMNYRNNRNQYGMDRDKKNWQLERAAIEQLDGLRRQLFETAWHLADNHDFRDELRLTEKQIKQFDAILLDTDVIRKYSRLKSIRNHFEAYPPFWYYLGNAANTVANDKDVSLDSEIRNEYKQAALQSFNIFENMNKSGHELLREDDLAASCYLEHADLLDPNKDQEKIAHLLSRALNIAESSFDVKQLCAIGYIKIRKYPEAIAILKTLVNEGYNTVVNAQLLSSLYVDQYIKDNNKENRRSYYLAYRILETRVNPDYLLKVPQANESTENLYVDFKKTQRKILKTKYHLVFNQFIDKYETLFNQIIPLPDQSAIIGGRREDISSLYHSNKAAMEERIHQVDSALKNKNYVNIYENQIGSIQYSYRILDVLNAMFDAVCDLEVLQDENIKLEMQDKIKSAIIDNKDKIASIEASLKSFNLDVYKETQKISLKTFADEFFRELVKKIVYSINQKEEMFDFCMCESNLTSFCDREKLQHPEVLYEHKDDADDECEPFSYFPTDLLGNIAKQQAERIKKNNQMVTSIKNHIDRIINDKNKVSFYLKEDRKMVQYFNNHTKLSQKNIRVKALAILDETTMADNDLIFTTEGIVRVRFGVPKKTISYDKIDWASNNKDIVIGGNYSNKYLNMNELIVLVNDLARFEEKKEENQILFDATE